MKNRIFVSRPCPSSEDWQALLSGNLPTGRIEEIEAHLDGCPVCVARLDAMTPSLPEELWEAAREPATVTPEWAARCHEWAEVVSTAELADEGPLLFERPLQDGPARSGIDLPALPPQAPRGALRDGQGCGGRTRPLRRRVSPPRMLLADARYVPHPPAPHVHRDRLYGIAAAQFGHESVRLRPVDTSAFRSAARVRRRAEGRGGRPNQRGLQPDAEGDRPTAIRRDIPAPSFRSVRGGVGSKP
jgi:Putative zinc-finger